MSKHNKQGRLLYGITEKNADLLYVLPVMLPDPAIWMEHGSQKIAVVGRFEVQRVRRQMPDNTAVYSFTEALNKYQQHTDAGQRNDAALIIYAVSRTWELDEWLVSSDFPLETAQKLMDKGLHLKAVRDFHPERRCKSAVEVKHIKQSVKLAEGGMQHAFDIVKAADISSDHTLTWRDTPLTSEILRGEINAHIALHGGTAEHTIAACGAQAADPHECGSGALKANEPIVIDIFPRDDKTGYHGDLTRTIVKGTAPEYLKGVYSAVQKAKTAAIEKARQGIPAKQLHSAAQKILDNSGFHTDINSQPPTGFIHGLGHGLGLEVHEVPAVNSRNDSPLATGNVITIEPGLYYPGWGGVRLEDVIVIEEKGCKNLTTIATVLEIP